MIAAHGLVRVLQARRGQHRGGGGDERLSAVDELDVRLGPVRRNLLVPGVLAPAGALDRLGREGGLVGRRAADDEVRSEHEGENDGLVHGESDLVQYGPLTLLGEMSELFN